MLASGGGVASPLWRQILADVLNAEIAIPRAPKVLPTEPPCSPAWARAGFRLSTRRAQVVSSTAVASPGPDVDLVCGIGYEMYATLYPTLREPFHRALTATWLTVRSEDVGRRRP